MIQSYKLRNSTSEAGWRKAVPLPQPEKMKRKRGSAWKPFYLPFAMTKTNSVHACTIFFTKI